jgi:hypothetical protein
MKLLWVAIRDIEDRRAQQRAKTSQAAEERTCTEGSSNAPNSKAGTAAYGALSLAFQPARPLGRRSSRTLRCRLAMVIRQRPDHEDVNADDQERPPGRVWQPDEVE